MTDDLTRRGILLAGSGGAFGLYSWAAAGHTPAAQRSPALKRLRGAKPRNMLFVLTDDHRHDAMGFMKAQSFGDTPTLDRLAREGVHFRNAFVTTALCSPSRASILTGLYAHQHKVVDEGLARIMKLLEQRGELDDTLILYMGDNGFMFGEHGLIDKRTAYEESMRVPMIARCPAMFGPGVVEQVVANIDIAPTMLAVAGLQAPATMAGANALPLAQGKPIPWRSELLYEYYWERNFPQTPTVHALREDRYKYIHFHGIWDIDELYDLQADPDETENLLARPGHEQLAERMSAKLFALLEKSDGMQIPLTPDTGGRNERRDPDGSKGAPFPPRFFRPVTAANA
jgi:arylsulfatase A-like enzyme